MFTHSFVGEEVGKNNIKSNTHTKIHIFSSWFHKTMQVGATMGSSIHCRPHIKKNLTVFVMLNVSKCINSLSAGCLKSDSSSQISRCENSWFYCCVSIQRERTLKYSHLYLYIYIHTYMVTFDTYNNVLHYILYW